MMVDENLKGTPLSIKVNYSADVLEGALSGGDRSQMTYNFATARIII